MNAIVSRFRPRLAFVAVIAAAFVAGLLAVVATSARAEPVPVITYAAADSTNHLVVKWKPNGHRRPTVFWDSSSALYTVPEESWIGAPLFCHYYYVSRRSCTGYQTANYEWTSYTATSLISEHQLAPGTYYVQVADGFGGTPRADFQDDNRYWSNVVQVIVSAIGPGNPSAQLQFGPPGRLPGARIGHKYSYSFCRPQPRKGYTCGPLSNQVQPRGGNGGPYTFRLKVGSGTLPSGLQLNSRTGTLSGTPRGRPGDNRFKVCVKDFGSADAFLQKCSNTIRLRVRR